MKKTKYYLCVRKDKEGAYLSTTPTNDFCIKLSKSQAADLIFTLMAREQTLEGGSTEV